MMVFDVFDTLSSDEQEFLDSMREWVSTHARDSEIVSSAGKLDLAQRILDSELLNTTDTWKLGAVGVLFGDALSQALEGRLKWVMVNDESGTSPALRWKDSDAFIFPLSTIRQRVQNAEAVNVRELYAEYSSALPFQLR